ncbi:60S ribosomal protein L7 [Gurleya vavrai]
MQKIIPETFSQIQNYKQQQAEILKKKKEKFEERKAKNNANARNQTIKHLTQYKQKQAEIDAKVKQAETENAFYVPSEPHFFCVVRIRGMNRVPPKERKTLDILRLRAPNSCILLKNNKGTRSMLQLVRNYVAFGYISLDLLRELVYKRGMHKDGEKVINITNEIIEDKFGSLSCLEDLISCLWNDKKFSEINRFFTPFRLSCPKGGFKGKKSKDFLDGGECGNQQFLLGNLIKRMID